MKFHNIVTAPGGRRSGTARHSTLSWYRRASKHVNKCKPLYFYPCKPLYSPWKPLRRNRSRGWGLKIRRAISIFRH